MRLSSLCLPTLAPSRLSTASLARVGSPRLIWAATGRRPRCSPGRGLHWAPRLPARKGGAARRPGEDYPPRRRSDAEVAGARVREAAG